MDSNRLRSAAPKGSVQLMYRVYKYILPEVRSELSYWTSQAEQIPSQELRKQALDSLRTKQFHCQGGAVYAAVCPDTRDVLIPLIVAFQTISDYLDNLCDRSTSLDPEDFRLLHESMLDAVQPERALTDYYAEREDNDDGGYLVSLVNRCRACVDKLPGYSNVRPELVRLVKLYTELQIYKHIEWSKRESALLEWWNIHQHQYTDLSWNEFAAATGSTLGMFQLFVLASCEDCTTQDAQEVSAAYFPYVCGLHILLDYFIDQEEDRIGGDLNFCHYYESDEMMFQRIGYFAERSCERVSQLPDNRFHRMIVEGLLALYLSDPKVAEQREVLDVSKRLMKGSPIMRLFFWINSRWIRKHM